MEDADGRNERTSLMKPQLVTGTDSLREAFGKALVDLAPKYKFLVTDADVAGGTGTHHFREKFIDRFYQIGIAEQSLMCVSAGLNIATEMPVFATTFATFAMRGWEQARLSIAYPKRNVKIVASHCGLDTGEDGASAQEVSDLACWTAMPNMVVISPCDSYEMRQATEAILQYNGPVYMRTGRSPCRIVYNSSYQFEIGRGHIVKEGRDVTIIACGKMVYYALQTANELEEEAVSARVINMSTIKPIDVGLLFDVAENTTYGFVTCEDHSVIGGLGSTIADVLVTKTSGCILPLEMVGIKDTFGESGEPEELMKKYELSVPHIKQAVEKLVKGG